MQSLRQLSRETWHHVVWLTPLWARCVSLQSLLCKTQLPVSLSFSPMAAHCGHAWLLLPFFSGTFPSTLPGVLLSADEVPGIPAGLPSDSECTAFRCFAISEDSGLGEPTMTLYILEWGLDFLLGFWTQPSLVYFHGIQVHLHYHQSCLGPKDGSSLIFRLFCGQRVNPQKPYMIFLSDGRGE